MSDDEQDVEPAPPPPGTNKVEITVGGHTVVVESAEPLHDVVGYAMGLFQDTAVAATRIPLGFDTTGGQVERAEPYVEPAALQPWGAEEERGERRLGGQHPPIATTRRLVHPDTPGGNRARLRPLPVDPEQRPLR